MPVLQNLPNLITIGRAVAVPFVITFLIDGDYLIAFWLFMIAGASDGIDGFLARVLKANSQLGAYLDPIADKALVIGVYVALAWLDHLPGWLAVIIFSRDLAIIAAIMIAQALDYEVEIKPHFFSKMNTALQIILAIYVLASLAYEIEQEQILMAGIYTVLATTIISWSIYLARWLRLMGGWEEIESEKEESE